MARLLRGRTCATLRSVDPQQPVAATETMDEVVSRSLVDRRFSLSLLGAFAGLALVLALVGIYGVMSYSVAQRTRCAPSRISRPG